MLAKNAAMHIGRITKKHQGWVQDRQVDRERETSENVMQCYYERDNNHDEIRHKPFLFPHVSLMLR